VRRAPHNKDQGYRGDEERSGGFFGLRAVARYWSRSRRAPARSPLISPIPRFPPIPSLRLFPLAALAVLYLAALPATAEPNSRDADVPVFEEVQRLVAERFYDPHFNGHDWAAIGERYRPLVLAAPPEERSAVISRMLAELGASHTAFLTRADPAYYDIADIFSGVLRRELPRVFPNGEVGYDGIGILTKRSAGRSFVLGILAGRSAEHSGLLTGDEIVAADGLPFDPVASFAGKAGRSVTLTIRRYAEGPLSEITVPPELIHPNAAYLEAIKRSARIIEAGPRKIGVMRLWTFGRRDNERAFEEALATGPLKDADALVWDLRGGWGGQADPDELAIFDPRGPVMTTINRAGETHQVNVRWKKPVVLLIDGGTRSVKEILAYGFKKYGFGPVVGTRSKGDVLAARAFMLNDGSILELPVDDVRVDGERLEGVGVTPTVEVPFTLEYSAGADPQLDRALAIAAELPHG
jgi:carboxyl-terminal processing protease